jgi:hypothetical protein
VNKVGYAADICVGAPACWQPPNRLKTDGVFELFADDLVLAGHRFPRMGSTFPGSLRRALDRRPKPEPLAEAA